MGCLTCHLTLLLQKNGSTEQHPLQSKPLSEERGHRSIKYNTYAVNKTNNSFCDLNTSTQNGKLNILTEIYVYYVFILQLGALLMLLISNVTA